MWINNIIPTYEILKGFYKKKFFFFYLTVKRLNEKFYNIIKLTRLFIQGITNE